MESKFTGSVLGFLGMKILGVIMVFVGIFTLYIATAWFQMRFQRWLASHTYIDGKQLRFDGQTMNYWVQSIVWVLLSIITLGIYALLFLSPRRQHWIAKHTHFAG